MTKKKKLLVCCATSKYVSWSILTVKKTQKDLARGKATIIRVLGQQNSIKYANILKEEIFATLKKYGKNSNNLKAN